MVGEVETDLTSQLSVPGLQLLASLTLTLQRTRVLLAELVSLFLAALNLLLQT